MRRTGTHSRFERDGMILAVSRQQKRRRERAFRQPVAERASPVRPIGSRPLVIAAALIALTLVTYAGVQQFDFVNWDDSTYLTENTNVQAGLTWANAWWALTTSHSPYWHPLTWLSHMLDVSLYGMNPGPQHVTSLVIHLASTLLLFAVLRRMTRDTWPSAFVAAVFAVHPLHVESVAWLAERKDVLSSFFLLLTIWMYGSYVARPDWRRYTGVVFVYALALMSKPMVVTLPFALLLLDVWPLRRIDLASPSAGTAGRLFLEKVPLIVLALVTSVATFIVQKEVGAVAGLSVLSLPLRIENALIGYVMYVWKTVWPSNLAAFYPLRDIPWWQAAGAAAVLAAVTAAAVRVRRRHPYVLVGWLWYLVTVAPVIGLMQAGEQARADRFMYSTDDRPARCGRVDGHERRATVRWTGSGTARQYAHRWYRRRGDPPAGGNREGAGRDVARQRDPLDARCARRRWQLHRAREPRPGTQRARPARSGPGELSAGAVDGTGPFTWL